MKIQILSDIHLEFSHFIYRKTDSDMVILAGDIGTGTKGVMWAIENIFDKPVLYVLGNHEYYGKAYPKLINKLKQIAENTNVSILENNLVQIEDVSFLGCTLWTDFKLFGDSMYAGYQANQYMTDYRKIRVSPRYSKLRSIDSAAIHRKSLNWLEKKLSNISSEKKVVITHHAPNIKSIPIQERNSVISAAYASDLSNLISKNNIKLWVHGHIHQSLDYMIDSTRIVCNPRGYPDNINAFFNPKLNVEI